MKKIIFFLSFLVSLIVFNVNAQQGESSFKSFSISRVPKPTAPANLVIENVTFSDKGSGNNNKALDANEMGIIQFRIINQGRGDAYSCMMNIEEINKIKGLSFDGNQKIGNIKAGESVNIVIPLQGLKQLETGKAKFDINITEANSFNANPLEVSVDTKKFASPKLIVADKLFTNASSGKIKLGETVNLKVVIQNIGQGRANNVTIKFDNPTDVFPGDKTDFSFKSLGPNESKIINYEFFANKQYLENKIPINISIDEINHQYGETKTLTVSLDESLLKSQSIDIASANTKETIITDVSLVSDVDKDIPKANKSNTHAYALIIGNEDYRNFQPGLSSEANVDFAVNDAQVFMDYCINSFGIPASNIRLCKNATTGIINQNIDWLNKIIKIEGGDAEVVVYYSGHGLPDEQTKEAYIVPVDVSATNIQYAVKLNTLYAKLTEFPAKKVTVFLDACFSGGARNAGLLASKGIVIKPKEDQLKGKIVVFTSSSGTQSSLSMKEGHHGIFTYYLLKKLQETKGNITYFELYNFLKKEVDLSCLKVNNKNQTPDLLYSDELGTEWRGWKL